MATPKPRTAAAAKNGTSTTASAPHPVTRTAEPALPVDALPGVPARDRRRLDDWITESCGLADAVEELEAKRKEINAKIAELSERFSLTAVDGSTGLVRRKYTGDRKTIKPELLLANGVTLKTIEKSTVVTEGRNIYTVTRRKA